MAIVNQDKVEGGPAWIDEDTSALIIGFPISKSAASLSPHPESVENNDNPLFSAGAKYFVRLLECERLEIDPESHSEAAKNKDIGPEQQSGFMIDDLTFLQEDVKTGDMSYIQYSEYTKKDLDGDRFGWINAFQRLNPEETPDELLEHLQTEYIKEMRGSAWIDPENDVLILGPAHDIRPEIRDSHFMGRLEKFYKEYPVWNKTKHWVLTETKLERTDVYSKMDYIEMLERYMS